MDFLILYLNGWYFEPLKRLMVKRNKNKSKNGAILILAACFGCDFSLLDSLLVASSLFGARIWQGGLRVDKGAISLPVIFRCVGSWESRTARHTSIVECGVSHWIKLRDIIHLSLRDERALSVWVLSAWSSLRSSLTWLGSRSLVWHPNCSLNHGQVIIFLLELHQCQFNVFVCLLDLSLELKNDIVLVLSFKFPQLNPLRYLPVIIVALLYLTFKLVESELQLLVLVRIVLNLLVQFGLFLMDSVLSLSRLVVNLIHTLF